MISNMISKIEKIFAILVYPIARLVICAIKADENDRNRMIEHYHSQII
jgi:hypothetical protein